MWSQDPARRSDRFTFVAPSLASHTSTTSTPAAQDQKASRSRIQGGHAGKVGGVRSVWRAKILFGQGLFLGWLRSPRGNRPFFAASSRARL